MKNIIKRTGHTVTLFLFLSSGAFADTTSPNIIITILQTIQTMVTGPLATAVGIIAIAGAGLYIAVSGDITSGGKKAAGITIGVGIAIMAAKLLTWAGLTGALI